MMISPEGYYEEYLKGKTKEQIMTAIRGLKQEMGRLKNTMEHPDYAPTMCPSESTRLWCSRMYLDRAKEALLEAGGVYVPSKAELKIDEFEDSIPYINKVSFTIGGFFNGHETRTFYLEGDKLQLDINHTIILKPSNFEIEPDYPITKQELLDGIRELHIAEWSSSYTLHKYGIAVLDGTQWELEISFSNGHKTMTYYGDNAYPYNFGEFCELIGVERIEEEEEADD